MTRLAVHEIGHTVGLVPLNTEIAADPLALSLDLLNMHGDTTRHGGTGGAGFIMFETYKIESNTTWKFSEYDWSVAQEVYLSKILP